MEAVFEKAVVGEMEQEVEERRLPAELQEQQRLRQRAMPGQGVR